MFHVKHTPARAAAIFTGRGDEMTTIIDYGAGNIRSVENALESLGEKAIVTHDRETILNSDRVILPGVGAFGSAMERIRERGLDETIAAAVGENKPFLGICLGLQVMFGSSEESKGAAGLLLFDGEIVRIPDGDGIKIPHIGWNSLDFKKDCPLFHGIANGEYVYFVHSYYLKAANRDDVAATTEYSATLDVAVSRGNLFATQFHPEKSGEIGLKMLKNFVEMK